jgi:hypothetical protein
MMNENSNGTTRESESHGIPAKDIPLTSNELQNLAVVEDRLQKDSRYVHLSPGESKILDFNLSRAPDEVPGRPFNGRTSTRTRFFVRYPEDEREREDRFFDVNKRSTRLIITKLRQGHRRLRIERVGSGLDTMYIPHEVYI